MGTSTSIWAVRVAGSSTGDEAGDTSLEHLAGVRIHLDLRRHVDDDSPEILLDEVRDEAHEVDVHHRQERRVGAHEGAGIQAPASDEAVDGGEDSRVREVDAELFQPRRRLIALGLGQVDLGQRRVVPRLGVVQRLPRDQAAPEQVPGALEVALGVLEVGFALPDGGPRHFQRGLVLAHLLAQLAVLERRQQLAPAHRVAEADVHRLDAAADLGHDVNRDRANQVADHHDALSHVEALRRRGFHGHRRSEGAASRRSAAAAAPATGLPGGRLRG